ncbi:hypothetical protein EDB81DRAFT_863138 [Dactylonectria macrodidyma]|uniref:Cytochrome P450 n=1 Tax=Dactylonectria macrodidyma TaxID=307937 RepID=A0A9P9D0A5_9HYPO|nr:hypothetical protein EDB81DRAFT_863138 [Dactylonectria macrodidyma]
MRPFALRYCVGIAMVLGIDITSIASLLFTEQAPDASRSQACPRHITAQIHLAISFRLTALTSSPPLRASALIKISALKATLSPALAICRGSTSSAVSTGGRSWGQRIPKATIVAFSLTGPTFQKPGLRTDEAKRSESAHKVQSRDGRVVDWTESAYPAGEFKEAVFDQQAGPFLAFSSGKRGCWGKRLAYLELKLVGTLLLWNFDFERTPEPMNSWKLEEDIFVKPKVCCVRLSNITET